MKLSTSTTAVAAVAAVMTCNLVEQASAFGVARPTTTYSLSSTSLSARLPESEMTPEMAEIAKLSDRWAEIRLYTDEEAKEKLSGEELEAYERYHSGIKADFEKMKTLAEMMVKSSTLKQVAKKSKTQKKKDAWARAQARLNAN